MPSCSEQLFVALRHTSQFQLQPSSSRSGAPFLIQRVYAEATSSSCSSMMRSHCFLVSLACHRSCVEHALCTYASMVSSYSPYFTARESAPPPLARRASLALIFSSAGTRRGFSVFSSAWHVRHRASRPNTSLPFANRGASAGASSGRWTTCTASMPRGRVAHTSAKAAIHHRRRRIAPPDRQIVANDVVFRA